MFGACFGRTSDSRLSKRASGDSNLSLFHAIDSGPVWWTGPEAGGRESSPASSVDRECGSGLVSSLVITIVVKLTFSLRRLRVAESRPALWAVLCASCAS